MTLLAPEFERKMRELHRAELKRDPALQKEFKRQRKAESAAKGRLLRRAILPIFWTCLFVTIAAKAKSPALAGAVIALWAAGTAFRWGQNWFQQFYASEDLVVLNLLPLNDRQIFRLQMRRYFASAAFIGWELVLAYFGLALLDRSRFETIYLFPIGGLLQAALVIALAIHCASRLHALPLGTLGGLLRFTAVVLLFLGAQGVEWTRFIVQSSEWFLPTGWINSVLFHAPDDPFILVLLLPIAALIYLSRYSFHHLRGFYSLEGFEIIPTFAGALSDDHSELSPASFDCRLGPTEMEDRIAARSFLQGVNWESAGPIERFVARFLTPRDRVITEFLVAQDPGWTRSLKWTFWVWLMVSMLVLVLGHLGGTIVFFAAYLLASASLPLFGGDWRGMRQTATGALAIPGYALYPISFNAIAGIFLKVNLIRICAASPFIVSFAALAAAKLNQPPLTGALIGFKLLGLLLAVQPLVVLFPISSTTNDTSRMRLAWVFIFGPVFLLMLGAVASVFLASTLVGTAGSLAVLTLLSTILFFSYRRAYRRGKFDLIHPRTSQAGT